MDRTWPLIYHLRFLLGQLVVADCHSSGKYLWIEDCGIVLMWHITMCLNIEALGLDIVSSKVFSKLSS